MYEYVPYVGQEPPPWTPPPSPVRWWWTRAHAIRAYERCREALAWERWRTLKLIYDYKLAVPTPCDCRCHDVMQPGLIPCPQCDGKACL